MKVQFFIAGILFCVAVHAAGKPTRSPQSNSFAPAVQASLTGCVDEQDGHYVLLDNQMVKITGLESSGPEKEVFAKYLGHMVRLKGSRPAGPTALFKVTNIVQLADNCTQSK